MMHYQHHVEFNFFIFPNTLRHEALLSAYAIVVKPEPTKAAETGLKVNVVPGPIMRCLGIEMSAKVTSL